MKRIRFRSLIRVIFRTFILLELIGFCTGCAYSVPPTKTITEGQKSLVLLRVTCEITGESEVEPVQGCISGENANMAMGDFETGGLLKPIILPKFLSTETGKQGWTYFILEPGIYYLGLQGQRRTDAFTYKAQWENVQRYRIDIQPDSPVVYIGTMHLQCRSAWFLFGAKYCCFIHNQVVKNEEELAQKLVSENLKTMDRPKTALMQLHNEETFIFGTPKPDRENQKEYKSEVKHQRLIEEREKNKLAYIPLTTSQIQKESGLKLAIFPWKLVNNRTYTDSETTIRAETESALKKAIKADQVFIPEFSYYDIKKVKTKKISNEILNKTVLDNLWIRKNTFSSFIPNVDLICNIGKKLHVDAILTYYIYVSELIDVNAFLINVKTKKIYHERSSGQGTPYNVTLEFQMVTNKVYAAYEKDASQ